MFGQEIVLGTLVRPAARENSDGQHHQEIHREEAPERRGKLEQQVGRTHDDGGGQEHGLVAVAIGQSPENGREEVQEECHELI